MARLWLWIIRDDRVGRLGELIFRWRTEARKGGVAHNDVVPGAWLAGTLQNPKLVSQPTPNALDETAASGPSEGRAPRNLGSQPTTGRRAIVDYSGLVYISSKYGIIIGEDDHGVWLDHAITKALDVGPNGLYVQLRVLVEELPDGHDNIEGSDPHD